MDDNPKLLPILILVHALYGSITPIMSEELTMTGRPEVFDNDKPKDLLCNSVIILLLFMTIYTSMVMTPFSDSIFSKVRRKV